MAPQFLCMCTYDASRNPAYSIMSSTYSFSCQVPRRAREHQQQMDGLQWGCDQKRHASFRCRIHRVDYTAPSRRNLLQIKLNTRDYTQLWNTLDHNQCDPLFKLILKRWRFEDSYTKYSNTISHSSHKLLLMKCDGVKRQQRQQPLKVFWCCVCQI